MSPPIITCALTGGYHDKTTHPNLPEQPDEIVEQGIRAWEAGAAVLHVHARDPDGHNTMDKEIYREIHERLCAETDAIVQLTTGGGLAMSLDERLTTALLNPEMCSLNMGFVLFFQRGRGMMLANPRPQIERYAQEMRERGVKPELELYNVTMLEEAERLIEAGLLTPPYNLSFVLNTPGQGAARGTWQNLADMARRLPEGANCNVIAIGRAQLPLTTMGLAMGLNVRVGLEDNIRYSRDELATGQRAARRAHRADRTRVAARARHARRGARDPRHARPGGERAAEPGGRRRGLRRPLPGGGAVRDR